MEDKYVVVQWPDIQILMEHIDFNKYCYLINDYDGIIKFGNSAYFVLESFYDTVIKGESI